MGVRWTPFWKLDYYDPTKMGTIDIMHNLFLGLMQFPVQEVLGVEDAQAEEDHPVTIKELENTRRGVAALNLKALNCLKVSVLKVLCTESGIDISTAKKLKKKTSYSTFDDKCSEGSPGKITQLCRNRCALKIPHCQLLQASLQYCETPKMWF